MNFIQALRNGLPGLINYMRLPSQNCPHIKLNRKLKPGRFSNLTVFQEAQLLQTEPCYLSFGWWSKCCIQCQSWAIYFCRLRNPRRRCWRGSTEVPSQLANDHPLTNSHGGKPALVLLAKALTSSFLYTHRSSKPTHSPNNLPFNVITMGARYSGFIWIGGHKHSVHDTPKQVPIQKDSQVLITLFEHPF